jgi:hypothetical protein
MSRSALPVHVITGTPRSHVSGAEYTSYSGLTCRGSCRNGSATKVCRTVGEPEGARAVCEGNRGPLRVP